MTQIMNIPMPFVPPHGHSSVFSAGAIIKDAKAAMIMIHGRGATAKSILDLAQYLDLKNVIYIAPQAEGNIWYPYGFMNPEEKNEPGLSSALHCISGIVEHVVNSGIPEEKIMVLGFSQGACLALEWTARIGKQISAVFGLSGGLIGARIDTQKYRTNIEKTTVFLGCSDMDFHIPRERVIDSAALFEKLHAKVILKLYANMGHTINQDEIEFIMNHINTVVGDV